LDDVLFHLEVGNAVDEQAARLAALLVDVHFVADAGELLGGGEPGRPRSDDRDPLAGPPFGRLGRDPTLLERPVGDGALDRLDGDRLVVDVERAGGLTRRRAHAARYLRKVIGRMQVERRRLPLVAIDEIVPVGDLVVHRAAVVTVGNAAVHAARGLLFHLFFRQWLDE